jgi:hypothetical protein
METTTIKCTCQLRKGESLNSAVDEATKIYGGRVVLVSVDWLRSDRKHPILLDNIIALVEVTIERDEPHVHNWKIRTFPGMTNLRKNEILVQVYARCDCGKTMSSGEIEEFLSMSGKSGAA